MHFRSNVDGQAIAFDGDGSMEDNDFAGKFKSPWGRMRSSGS